MTPEESPLLGTAAVPVEETKDRDNNISSESDQGGDKSKSDDTAVLQALYDDTPLSGVFHHGVAEGTPHLL